MALKQRKDYRESIEGQNVIRSLQSMFEDRVYNTGSSYSANTAMYPDNLMPFIDKHMNYLIAHPSIEANTYIANLRLMTRVR